MFYLQYHILVLIANTIAIHGYYYREPRNYVKRRAGNGIKLNHQINENREELRRIIEMLNGHLREEKRERDVDSNTLRNNGAGVDDDGVVDDQVDRLKSLLGRLQRSYDNRIKKEADDIQNSRIHVIANPEVLEEFKRRIRARHQSTSSDDSDTNLSGGLSFYKKRVVNANNNHAPFTNEDNVSLDVGGYPVIAPAKRGNVILVMRKSRIGAPQKIKQGSNELYEDSKISWGQVEASHEKFIPKKEKKVYEVDKPKQSFNKQPVIYSDEAPPLKSVKHGTRDEVPARSSEGWSKPKVKVNLPKWEEPRPYRSNKSGRGNSRTSIPYIGHHNVYDDEK